MATIEERIKKIKTEDTAGGTKTLMYKGKQQTLHWYSIPTSLLKYNFLNNRLATEITEFNQIGKDLSTIDPNEANKIVSKWLWEKSEKENRQTLEDLKKKGQIEPGVITSDGIIVDGNRRFMLTCRINKNSTQKKEFRAVILDDTYGEGKDKDLEIKLLETDLQISTDKIVNYGPIEKYISISGFMKYVEDGLLEKENIIEMFKLKNLKELNHVLNTRELMRQYLDHIGMPNMWSRLKNTEDLFKRLEECLSLYKREKGRVGWNFKSYDIIKFKTNAFDLIRWIYNSGRLSKDWNPKKIRDLYFRNSESKTVFANEKIFNEFSETIKIAKQKLQLPSVETHSQDNNIDKKQSAELIDKTFAGKINDSMLEALGRAKSKISDKEKINQPSKLITDALHKLENLVNEEKLSENIVSIDPFVLKYLKDKNREQNLKEVNLIRKIAERLKSELK